jgi:cytoskeletal protein CcmA (bactofilin family)
MFRRRRASEVPNDTPVETAPGAAAAPLPSDHSAEITPFKSASDVSTDATVDTGPASPDHAAPESADSPPSASDPKGPAMSATTPPRTPGRGFVPEIPRRSAADIPGAPVRRAPGRANEESKRLLVGRDISLSGEITACDTLIVEGTVQATLEHSQSLEVTETGLYKGKVTIEDAVIGGRFEGELTVRGTLKVTGTGVLEGTVRFGQLEVERGGVIKGDIAPTTDA